MPPPIVPCLRFDEEAEAAATLYAQTFGGKVSALTRVQVDTPSGKPRGSVLTVEFEAGGRQFTALNGGPMFKPGPNISFFVHVKTPAEADRTWAALKDGGTAMMPLDTYPWSERYGWVQDRFGVSWQVIPANIGELLRSPSAFAALLTMQKLDIAALERA